MQKMKVADLQEHKSRKLSCRHDRCADKVYAYCRCHPEPLVTGLTISHSSLLMTALHFLFVSFPVICGVRDESCRRGVYIVNLGQLVVLAGLQTGGWAQTIRHHLFEFDWDCGGPPDPQLSFLQKSISFNLMQLKRILLILISAFHMAPSKMADLHKHIQSAIWLSAIMAVAA